MDAQSSPLTGEPNYQIRCFKQCEAQAIQTVGRRHRVSCVMFGVELSPIHIHERQAIEEFGHALVLTLIIDDGPLRGLLHRDRPH